MTGSRKMGNKSDRLGYPKPFVVEPQNKHEQSVIILHGRGSNGEKFGSEFLKSQTTLNSANATGRSGLATFADIFLDAKFIFPTAKKRRARWYNRATINQWFDSVPIDEQDAGVSQEEEWQLEGLQQSRAFLKEIVDHEIGLVGAANVFIGGLSQGCAMGLHLLLSCDDSQPLGGFVGMSGWLPFADAIEAIICPGAVRDSEGGEDEAEDDDPFAASDTEEVNFDDEPSHAGGTGENSPSPATNVCNFVRDNMDLPPTASSPRSQPSWLSIPVFMGHGKSDEKVKIVKGLRAANCLRDLGMQVNWSEYDEGHWYKVPDEIDAIVEFLQTCLSPQAVGRQKKETSG